MQNSGGCMIRSDDEVEQCQMSASDKNEMSVRRYKSEDNVMLAIVNDRPDYFRTSGERRMRDEALSGYQTSDKSSCNGNVSELPKVSTWNDFKMFTSFLLSLIFGLVLPVVQFLIGGVYFGSCHGGNVYSVFLVVGGMLDIAGSSTYAGLVHRIMEKEELSRDPQTEWSKRIWNVLCGLAILAWIVIGEMKIYYMTHHVNPFRRGLPCAQANGLTFYVQVFLVIKMAAIAMGLSLGITYLFLRKDPRLCWRKYSLKKNLSV